MRPGKRILPLLTGFVCLVLAAAAYSEPEAKSTAKKPSWLQLSFEQRTRFETLTNPFRFKESGTERFSPLRTRLKLELGEAGKPVRFLVEFQDSRGFLDNRDLFSTSSHVNKNDFLQLQIQLNSKNFLRRKLESSLIAGRFTVDLGKRRLVARNGMRNTTNAFDGVLWSLAGDSKWKVQTFFTSPVIIDPEKLDSGSFNRYFWGIYFESSHFKRFRTETYYFGLRENNRTSTQRRHSTIGLRVYKKPAAGKVDFEVESAWQFGSTKAQDHFSHLQHGEVGFSFNSRWNPRLSSQFDYAEGDDSPQDKHSRRFNTLYGARSFEYTPTGIFGPFYRSNLSSPGVRVVFNPVKTLEFTVSQRAFWLARAKDAWVGSGLLDSSGKSGLSLGQNLETCIRWRPRSFFLLEAGYSRFFKGSYLDRVSGSPRTGDSNYFYIATEIRGRLLPY